MAYTIHWVSLDLLYCELIDFVLELVMYAYVFVTLYRMVFTRENSHAFSVS